MDILQPKVKHLHLRQTGIQNNRDFGNEDNQEPPSPGCLLWYRVYIWILFFLRVSAGGEMRVCPLMFQVLSPAFGWFLQSITKISWLRYPCWPRLLPINWRTRRLRGPSDDIAAAHALALWLMWKRYCVSATFSDYALMPLLMLTGIW